MSNVSLVRNRKEMPRKPILILFLLALAFRLLIFGAMFHYYGPGSFYLDNAGSGLNDNDSQNYVTIARNLVEHHAYSLYSQPPFQQDSYRTPLMPLFFTPFIALFGFGNYWIGVLAMDAIVSFTAVLAYWLARRFVSERRAMIIGVLVALEPLLAYRSNIAEPDALAILLLLAVLLCAVKFLESRARRHLLWAAFFLGLLALAKPVFGIHKRSRRGDKIGA